LLVIPPARGAAEKEEQTMNVLTWDLVTLLSITMVVIAVAIVVFLGFKVAALMNRDAEAHKKDRQ
jgi:hypothetical protein